LSTELVFLVVGMITIGAITVALVRAPRRKHRWEEPGKSPTAAIGPQLRRDRWRPRPMEDGREPTEEERALLRAVEEKNASERAWAEQAREQCAGAAPAASVDEDTLRDLEAYARAADELSDRTDEDGVVQAGVKRRFLFAQLAAFSLLDPNEQGLAESLERRGLSLLAGHHRAACALARYLQGPDRAAIVGLAPSPLGAVGSGQALVLGAPFSLDLFRRGGLVVPADLPPGRVLAMAEAELLRDPENTRGAFVHIKSAGFRYTFRFRVEDGIRTVLRSLEAQRVG
jgi:hypothetical protein